MNMRVIHFLYVTLTALFLASGLTKGQVDLCQIPDEYDIRNLTL